MKRGVALLNGFISYASTYKAGTHEGDQGKSDAEREKLHHEERRKAMEALIDSATDRTYRRDKWIWSAGVGVGLGFNMRYAKGEGLTDVNGGGELIFVPQLALPTGVAVDKADVFAHGYGLHFQAVLFDLGQYAALDSSTWGIAKPNAGSAISTGGIAALSIGSPRAPLLLGLQGGFAPGFQPDDFTPPCVQPLPPAAPVVCQPSRERKPGGGYFGVFVGTYVPFFDFN